MFAQHPEITDLVYLVGNSAATGAIFDTKLQPGQLYAHNFHRKMTQFLNYSATHTVEIGHSNIKGNDRADELAKEATQMTWSAPMGTSSTNALRRAKASAQKTWVCEWQRSPRNGKFSMAPHFTPPNTCWTSVTNAKCSEG